MAVYGRLLSGEPEHDSALKKSIKAKKTKLINNLWLPKFDMYMITCYPVIAKCKDDNAVVSIELYDMDDELGKMIEFFRPAYAELTRHSYMLKEKGVYAEKKHWFSMHTIKPSANLHTFPKIPNGDWKKRKLCYCEDTSEYLSIDADISKQIKELEDGADS